MSICCEDVGLWMVAAAHTTYQHYPSFFIIFRDDFGYIAIALKRNFNQASQRKVVHKSPQISRCLIGLCCFNPCYQNIMTRSGLYCQGNSIEFWQRELLWFSQVPMRTFIVFCCCFHGQDLNSSPREDEIR